MASQLPAASRDGPNRILLARTSPLDLLVGLLACWCAGSVPVILRESGAPDNFRQLQTQLSASAIITDDGLHAGQAAGPKTGRMRFAARDEALVVCTSGTISLPKLVALPTESVLVNAAVIGRELGLTAGDVIAVATPLTYMYGLMGGTMAGLWAGATVRFFKADTPHSALQAAIRREGVTMVQGPPSFMRLFMSYWNGLPFDRVRLVTTGGEPVQPSLLERIATAFPSSRAVFAYGMTEAGPRISHAAFERGGGTDGNIGTPFPHIGWRIEPVSGQGLPAGAGRLVLSGPSLFLGYIGADGRGYHGLEPDGSFVSNDLVQLTGDGTLRYLGRCDRIFKSGGRLINPAEVEAVLARHPAVGDALCYAQTHDILGLIPVAEVVPASGDAGDAAVLAEHCKQWLQRHAVPRRIVFVEGFAVTPSGKRSGRPTGS